MEAILYPPDLMWDEDEEGNTLTEKYPGARDVPIIAWGTILPFTGGGFFTVGVSTWLGENGYNFLVDYTPLGNGDIGMFLRPSEKMHWLPQGIFMTFYGFFAFFVISPLIWWLVINNVGEGRAEFNKITKKFTLIKDGDILKEVDFDQIAKIRFEWGNLALAIREIYIVTLSGETIRFLETVEDPPKRVMERKATILADFLGVPLEVDDR